MELKIPGEEPLKIREFSHESPGLLQQCWLADEFSDRNLPCFYTLDTGQRTTQPVVQQSEISHQSIRFSRSRIALAL